MARAREPRFLGSARRPRMHTQGACTGSNVYTCVREGPCSEGLSGRAHTPCRRRRDPPLSVFLRTKPSGVRGASEWQGCAPCLLGVPTRTHSTQAAAMGWAKSGASMACGVHGSRAPPSASTRGRSLVATDSALSTGGRPGFPARSGRRSAHKRLSCDGVFANN